MLTPPPSPRPLPVVPSSDFVPPSTTELSKKSQGRRYTLAVFVVPLILVLITASSFYVRDWYPTYHVRQSSSPFVIRETQEEPSSLRRRATSSSSSTGAPIFNNPLAPTPQSSSPGTSTSAPSSSSPSATAVPTIPSASADASGIVPTPFPQPFDVSLSSNFSTASCQNFFLNFTQDTDFRRCRPMSLLLGSSVAFNQAQSNITLLTDIIWGTCNTVESEVDCQTKMNNLTSTLQVQCQTEVSQNNALVQQALTGFEMYTAMRDAACQVDSNTNAYCLAEAVANPSPADLYFYLLPYGSPLPNGTVPSCSSCIKSVLGIYAQAVTAPSSGTSLPGSSPSGVPLDRTYPEAAQIAVDKCGAVYAQQVNISAGFANGLRHPTLALSLGLFVIVLTLL